MSAPLHTPGPWECVPATVHHGAYVVSDFGCTIADCYTMSHLGEASTLNGGPSKPVLFLHEMAEPNARLIAAAPELYADNEFAADGMDEVASAIESAFPLHAEGLRVAAKRLRATAAKARGDA